MSCEAPERGVRRRGYWNGPVGWAKSPHSRVIPSHRYGDGIKVPGQCFGFPSQRLVIISCIVIAIYHMLSVLGTFLSKAPRQAAFGLVFFSSEKRDVSKELETLNHAK